MQRVTRAQRILVPALLGIAAACSDALSHNTTTGQFIVVLNTGDGLKTPAPVAERLQGWLDEGRDVYAYFNNDYDAHAIADGRWLAQRLGTVPAQGWGGRARRHHPPEASSGIASPTGRRSRARPTGAVLDRRRTNPSASVRGSRRAAAQAEQRPANRSRA